jgi:hypothetical protein
MNMPAASHANQPHETTILTRVVPPLGNRPNARTPQIGPKRPIPPSPTPETGPNSQTRGGSASLLAGTLRLD